MEWSPIQDPRHCKTIKAAKTRCKAIRAVKIDGFAEQGLINGAGADLCTLLLPRGELGALLMT